MSPSQATFEVRSAFDNVPPANSVGFCGPHSRIDREDSVRFGGIPRTGLLSERRQASLMQWEFPHPRHSKRLAR